MISTTANKVNIPVQEKWNRIYRSDSSLIGTPQAARVLADFAYLLPEAGYALDMASGRGGNALFLAKHGLESVAWDISNVALEQLRSQAERLNLLIHTEVRDIEKQCLPTDCFDVIVISHFLNRSICEHIVKMLKSRGLLFYQTFTIDSRTNGTGPKNPDYLLKRNELIKLFNGLQLHGYREDGLETNSDTGLKGQAYLVGRKH